MAKKVTAPDMYAFSAPLLNGQPAALGEFRGQVLLIVNTASRCGFTPQYAGLQQLYQTYKERGFSVLAFPSNQFGAQEPGTADEIGAFCQREYAVDFPVFGKIDVNGPTAHPLFQFLKLQRPGIFGTKKIKWNFTKFLIDRKGNVIRRYAPGKKPHALVKQIEGLLAENS